MRTWVCRASTMTTRPARANPEARVRTAGISLLLWAMVSCPRTGPQQCSAAATRTFARRGCGARRRGCTCRRWPQAPRRRFACGPSTHRAVEHVEVEGGEDIVEGGDGGGGEALRAMAVVGAKGAQLLLGQRLGELGEGHDDRQRIAPPAPVARLRNCAQTLEQAAKAIGGQGHRLAFASPMRTSSSARSCSRAPTVGRTLTSRNRSAIVSRIPLTSFQPPMYEHGELGTDCSVRRFPYRNQYDNGYRD